jgi:hypothetical protein
VHTFVVRIFGPQREEAELRGTVDEVSSGLTATFHDAGELMTILSQSAERGEIRGAADAG